MVVIQDFLLSLFHHTSSLSYLFWNKAGYKELKDNETAWAQHGFGGFVLWLSAAKS